MEGDTIVARATPPGRGAVALVRLSGPGSREVLRRIAPARAESLLPRTPALVPIVDPDDGALLDRALVTLFPAPASFTGEDVVEISTHGGSLVPRLVEEACVRAGARPARPGEFTERAYLHGKLDLVQAEALGDLIEGRSRAAHRTALHQMEGGLSRRLARVREGIVGLEAVLVHHLDFPEEDDAPLSVGEVAARADALVEELEKLRRTAPEGMLLREGALVVLAGPPNAGKSSLFNALLGEERAIVTEEPGTTRDALEAAVTLGGFPFRLVDTAGLREEAGRVERLGIEVARRYLDAARVILYCHPAGSEWSGEELDFLGAWKGREGTEVRVLLTKWDEVGGGTEGAAPPDGEMPVSVRSGEGLDLIRSELGRAAFAGLVEDGGGEVVTRGRQLRGIERAAEELAAFAAALRGGVPAEMAATHLRPAETALEELLGVIDPEEVLDHLFREFCIGK